MFNSTCNKCNSHQGCSCNNNLIAGTQVNNLATSIVTTIPGPVGPEGDTYVPQETDNIFEI